MLRLLRVSMGQPEVGKRRRKAHEDLALLRVARPLERAAHVVVLGGEARVAATAHGARLGRHFAKGLAPRRNRGRTARAAAVIFASSPLAPSRSTRVLADRLEHPEALAGVADQALVDQRLQHVEVGLGDLLGRLEGAAAVKTARRAKRRCSSASSRSWLHAIVARSVCWRGSASRPPLSRSSRCDEPLEDLLGESTLVARRGQLDRERQVVQAAAELGDRLVGGSEARERSQNSSTASGPASGGTGYSTSPLNAQELAAGDQQLRFGQRLDQPAQLGRGLDHLLEVVEQEQQLALADVLGQAVLDAEGLRDRLRHERRIAQRRQRRPRRRPP